MAQPDRHMFDFWTELPVLWGDVDRLGHVNNVQYFRYSEEGRTQWIDRLLATAAAGRLEDVGPILASIQCDFLRQLHHPADLDVGTRASKLGSSSMQVEQGIFINGEDSPVALLKSRIVWFDYQRQCSVPIPEALREQPRQDQSIPPEE